MKLDVDENIMWIKNMKRESKFDSKDTTEEKIADTSSVKHIA